MVGRAIDVHLSWPGGFCNNACLGNEARLPSGPRCFIAKIRNDPSRWGADFNDPGQIDDNLNNRDPAAYDRLRDFLQPICSEVPWLPDNRAIVIIKSGIIFQLLILVSLNSHTSL